MATRTKSSPTERAPRSVRSPARRSKPLPKTASPSPPANPPAKPHLLRAGLKALGTVRDDVVQHQSRVFQAILGIPPGKGWSSLIRRGPVEAAAPEDPDQGRFEAVFDQRVAQALQHLGAPSPAALRALVEEMAAMRSELDKLKAKRKR